MSIAASAAAPSATNVGQVVNLRRIGNPPFAVLQELKALAARGLPHADWIAKILVSATLQMP